MLLFDPFLCENFIKCFARYCAKVPDVVKEVFIDAYIEERVRHMRCDRKTKIDLC